MLMKFEKKKLDYLNIRGFKMKRSHSSNTPRCHGQPALPTWYLLAGIAQK